MGWEVSLKKKKLIKVILGNKRCKTSRTFISSIDGMNILISFKFLSDVWTPHFGSCVSHSMASSIFIWKIMIFIY